MTDKIKSKTWRQWSDYHWYNNRNGDSLCLAWDSDRGHTVQLMNTTGIRVFLKQVEDRTQALDFIKEFIADE